MASHYRWNHDKCNLKGFQPILKSLAICVAAQIRELFPHSPQADQVAVAGPLSLGAIVRRADAQDGHEEHSYFCQYIQQQCVTLIFHSEYRIRITLYHRGFVHQVQRAAVQVRLNHLAGEIARATGG